jgi:glycosyltransferase involved in cell wall biosynthesis
MSKNIAIIGTVGIPAKYGGFETLTEYLTQNLGAKYNITVYCSLKNYDTKLEKHNNAKLNYINLKANGIQSIPYDIISIFRALKSSDVLLILGVSGCFVLPIVKLISKNKILVNIDGLEWKRAKWSRFAKGFLKLSEKIAVKYADDVITDNKVLQDYVKSIYGIKSRLIAYGADHVTRVSLGEAFLLNYPFAKDYTFKVCRIEPENNIHVILDAFSKVPEKNIICVGNWLNSDYGKNLKKEYEINKNIFLLDPIYDQVVLNQFRSNCSLYLHGHSAGGTNPSLVESMYLGLPIFAFGVDYNKETTENKALYFDDVSELVSLLNNVNENQLIDIGKDMQIIAKKKYTWSNISEQYSVLFNRTVNYFVLLLLVS